jgi:3-deoxy-D-manno-octulosonic-acid transferase
VLNIYRCIVALLFYCAVPLLLLIVFITGKHRQGLSERFGFYSCPGGNDYNGPTVWVHAASVGEVKAAALIIAELKKNIGNVKIVLTTMTVHGRRIAQSRFGGSVRCHLAPLDVPGIVARAIKHIQPDIYICIETELWPVLLHSLARTNACLYLLNGRISTRAYRRYCRFGRLLRHTLGQFDKMVVISAQDKARYIRLGADEKTITVEGNVKYDLVLPENHEEIVSVYRKLLQVDKKEVFIAGSTHSDEERMLLGLYDRLGQDGSILFIIAPRHIERIADIEKMFNMQKRAYQLYSRIEKGLEQRREALLLVDTMGELANLYGVADYIFCGGSLVSKGGHNLMEAAVWSKVVFYGPYISDFHDAADLLETGRAGYQVDSIDDLEKHIRHFRDDPDEYRAGCRRAGRIAEAQRGCSGRQVAIVLKDRGLC